MKQQPPYYALIFNASRIENLNCYIEMSENLHLLTKDQPGFIGIESVDGNFEITNENSAAPDCGSSGFSVFSNLDNGSYNYSASDEFIYCSGTVDIDGGCLTMELY